MFGKSGVLVVVVLAVVAVVVVVARHEPSLVGFTTLNRTAPLFVTWPLANCTLYESPPTMVKRAQPSEPGLGGTTATGPSLPSTVTLIWKTPFRSLSWALFTGPFSPFGSRYLKPFSGSPLQKAVPAGNAYVSSLGDAPLAVMVTVAPFVTGSPASVSSLGDSFALTVTFRFAGSPGFFTTNALPRTAWSAA